MYIRRKVFSVVTDENGEEKLFSTTEFINEEEYLKEFSDNNYRQKEFAKIDYKGLNIFQKFKLKNSRNAIARDLKKQRSQINKNSDIMLNKKDPSKIYSTSSAKYNTMIDRQDALHNSNYKAGLAKVRAKSSFFGK